MSRRAKEFIVALILLLVANTAWADSNEKLLALLIKKGIITQEEGASLKKEMEEEAALALAPTPLPKSLEGLKVSMLGYLDYSAGESGTPGGGGSNFNRYTITRGYLTVEKTIRPWMGVRMTSDVTQDSTGDWKFRLKYLYAQLKPGDLGPLTSMKSELGLGHMPWLDFEEHVNPYRCQGTMAIERAGIFKSADTGMSLMGNIGGQLEDAQARTGNHHYDGRYGSWHLGLYNGGGYHASEKNNNKVIEGRLTLRPFPGALPGLQFSYLGISGKGNMPSTAGNTPNYDVNLGMVSYEHPMAIVTAQYFITHGNASGSLVDSSGHSLETRGYSLFGRVKLPVLDKKLALFGRFDHFDADAKAMISSHAAYNLGNVGLSYEIEDGNMVLLAYEKTRYEKDSGGIGKVPIPGNRLGDDDRVQVVYQLSF
jgi:hypothetical protein